ncbi:dephospho-CoA kinase [Moorella thermoacetica]|uniref:Dephospho-CoA kinase n=1 Tax=Neomoorella thermoacetica TaxID=1525 RepID=A0A1J5NWW9_NEOTH|nr:dephospho-CoA kinase [Moorella thermoacetica]
MPVRFLLMGKAGAGKDTAAEYLVRRYGFRRYAFADKLKEIARDLWPEEFASGRKPRRLLQELGTAARGVDPLVWVRYVFRRLEAENPARAVITDGRLLNEYRACREAGFLVIRVDCPDGARLARLAARDGRPPYPEEASHATEHEFETLKPDFVLDNSGGTDDLYRQIDDLVWRLKIDPAEDGGNDRPQGGWKIASPALGHALDAAAAAVEKVRAAGPGGLERAVQELESACHRVRCACNTARLFNS